MLRPNDETSEVTDLEELGHAAELLQDLARLWTHPGVTPEQRREFAREAFSVIQLGPNH